MKNSRGRTIISIFAAVIFFFAVTSLAGFFAYLKPAKIISDITPADLYLSYEDIFFATIGLLYSCILMVHGWRLDPILLFSQVLIIASLLVAGWENIRLRGLLANMAKLNSEWTVLSTDSSIY